MTRLLPLTTLILALAALLPAAAMASGTQESVFEDDYELLQHGRDERGARSTTSSRSAPTRSARSCSGTRSPRDPGATQAPGGFDGNDPAAYGPAVWDRYDDLVRGAQARGMGVLFSPVRPDPGLGLGLRRRATRPRATCKPRREAVRRRSCRRSAPATRATYADENQGGGVLPRVDRWSIWNEPNQPGWLIAAVRGAQRAPRRHRRAPLPRAGPRRDRRAARDRPRLATRSCSARRRRSGAPAARSRAGRSRRWTSSARLFCLTARGRKCSGAGARATSCRRPARLAVTGFAHHPYTRGGSQPPRAKTAAGRDHDRHRSRA